MRGNVIAIIFLVFFVILAGGTGFYAYTAYQKVVVSNGKEGNLAEQLEKLKAASDQMDLDDVRQDIELRKAVATYQRTYEQRARKLTNLYALDVARGSQEQATGFAKDWLEAVKGFKAQNPNDLRTQAEEDAKARLAAATTLNTEQTDKIVERRKAINLEIAKIKADNKAVIIKLKGENGAIGNQIANLRSVLEQSINREPMPNAGLPPAGRVLASTADTRTAVINLGTRVGIKRGMRFEVYQVRYGNRRVHKGYLEVKDAQPEVSTCSILYKEIRLPRCPVCSYTAAQPEELYCPRCTAPGSPQAYQPLHGAPKVVTLGQSETDPIIKGDLLYNPLFGLKPGTRFTVVGDPLLAPAIKPANPKDDRETPRLLENLRQVIEFYGGVVDKKLGAETDVLIALRGAKEDVNRAEELGIPVVREFELFRFLEK